jgi:outer membrane protein assembly factor BamA
MRYVLLLLLLAVTLFGTPLSITFSGNEKISSDQLYSVLGLRKPYAIEVWEAQPAIESIAISQSVSALNSFYRSKGFYHARVTSQINENEVIFNIQENNPILIKDIKINSLLDIKSAISLHTDALFDQEAFSESKLQIKKRYGEAGYCNAQFNTKAWVDVETDSAYLLFEATSGEPCRFGKISVESTPNIDGNLTASMLRFDEGDT